MTKPSRIIVVAEDERHKNFVFRYLRRCDYSYHDIYFEDLPSGRGCGEQWVRDKYAINVKAYRARSTRAETALVVAIDADNGDVDRRVSQLRNALNQAQMAARHQTEKIIHLIPKRNIETWILCLTGSIVDEVTDYRHEPGVDGLVKPAAVEFFEWSRNHVVLPERCVPSLTLAIAEIRKLE